MRNRLLVIVAGFCVSACCSIRDAGNELAAVVRGELISLDTGHGSDVLLTGRKCELTRHFLIVPANGSATWIPLTAIRAIVIRSDPDVLARGMD